MRTQTFISSMVGVVAAMAVAGSANAAIVDPFTQSCETLATGSYVDGTAQSGSWLGGVFDRRTVTAIAMSGSGGVTPSGGLASSTRSQTGASSWVGSFAGDRPNTFPVHVGLDYWNANSSAVAIDFSKVMIDVAFAGTTRNAGSYVYCYFEDVNEDFMDATLTFTNSQLSASSLTIEFSKSQLVLHGTSFDWNQVTGFGVRMYAAGATGAGQTWTATNFQMTAVPAPGAAALIGLAGLVATRRRRN